MGPLFDGPSVFAPDVLGGELNVEHGGANLGMTHEMLESGQGDAGADHIGAEGMPKPMGISFGDLAAGAMMAEQGAKAG